MKKLTYLLPFYLAIIVFLASLGMTFFNFSGGSSFMGIYVLLIGWMFFLNDVATCLAWFANVFFFLGILSARKGKNKKDRPLLGMISAAMAFLIGIIGHFPGSIATEVSSETMAHATVGMGYYTWMLSFVILFVSMFLRRKARKAE